MMALAAPIVQIQAESRPLGIGRMLVGEAYPPFSDDKGGWESNAPTVAAVDVDALVSALDSGNALITQIVKNRSVIRASLLVMDSVQMPEQITWALDIAQVEWQASLEKAIGRSNNDTKGYCGQPCGLAWCGGLVSYCLDDAGLPMACLWESKLQLHGSPRADREADVLKLLRGYGKLDRLSNIP